MDGYLGHILVVEDEYLIAADLVDALDARGAIVLGPVSGLREATQAVEDAKQLDGAILDLNLRGEMSLPVADLLRAHNVPFVLTTGYAPENLPPGYRDIPLLAKPMEASEVVEKLAVVMSSRRANP